MRVALMEKTGAHLNARRAARTDASLTPGESCECVQHEFADREQLRCAARVVSSCNATVELHRVIGD